MSKAVVKTAAEADFFKRGRKLARIADRGEKLPREIVISFEDPADMLRLMTAARLSLLREVKSAPGSITAIAARLERDRSAVTRDVQALERAGVLKVSLRAHPGHGQLKEVRLAARRVKLEACVIK